MPFRAAHVHVLPAEHTARARNKQDIPIPILWQTQTCRPEPVALCPVWKVNVRRASVRSAAVRRFWHVDALTGILRTHDATGSVIPGLAPSRQLGRLGMRCLGPCQSVRAGMAGSRGNSPDGPTGKGDEDRHTGSSGSGGAGAWPEGRAFPLKHKGSGLTRARAELALKEVPSRGGGAAVVDVADPQGDAFELRVIGLLLGAMTDARHSRQTSMSS